MLVLCVDVNFTDDDEEGSGSAEDDDERSGSTYDDDKRDCSMRFFFHEGLMND